jgi:membrane-bound metal-dependent hydrolase YbcI (DUF457 family)
MSPIGHNVTAFAMATTYMRISDVPWGQGFSSLPSVMMSGNVVNIDHTAFFTLVALGMLLGARGPDRLEVPSFNRRTQTRRSVIPHRTLTHWPPFWAAMTAIFWSVLASTHDFLLYKITSVGFGFCAAGWLHLAMDIKTPSGIPLVTPFGSRFSFNLYKTSQSGEWLCILLFVVGCQFSFVVAA